MKRCLLTLGLFVTTAGLAWSGGPACCDDKAAGKAGSAATAALERLKQLVGDWEAVGSSEFAEKGKVAVRYKLTGGGTAVAETDFPDTPHEMLTVYHQDGDQLVMTHYCAAGNQPRMRARPGADKDEIVFEFTGGGNLNPEKDFHIHGGKIRFLGADRIHSEWTAYRAGKPAATHGFDLVRKKS